MMGIIKPNENVTISSISRYIDTDSIVHMRYY